jgi:chitodextrinase
MIARRSPSFWVAALLLAVILVPTTLAASRGDTASTRNPYNDRRAPKPVRVVEVTAADMANVTLTWPATSDNVGVEGYGVYLNGSRASETASTTYTVRSLACSTGYTVGVDAFDDAGNRSRQKSTFVSTAACLDVTPPSAPTDVKSVATAETSVVLSWTPSTDDFGVVAYGLYVGGLWVGQWSDPSATITNLSCGQNYTIGISALDAAGNTSPQTTAFFSTAPCADRTAPTTPTELAVSESTTTSVSLTWTASTDASGVAEYGLYKDATKVDITTSTSGDFDGLECGRTYTFGVDAADAAQNRSAVATLSAATAPCPTTTTPPPPPPPTTGSTVPTAPANLRTTSVTQAAVSLAWDSSSDPDGMSGYQIFRDGTKIGEGPGIHGGFTNTWNDTGLTCGTSYDYAVAGVDTTDTVGPRSTTLRVTTSACDPVTPPPPPPPAEDTTAPSKPANVTAGTRTATSIALSWQPSSDDVGVVGYGMYRGGTRIGTSTATTWIFSGLTCGTNYTLAVDAADAAGNRSPQSVLMVSTTACSDTQAPTAPADLNASNVNQTGLTLTWSASSDSVGVTGYDVYRNNSKVATVNATSATQSELTCGTSYTFAVSAFDAAGNHSAQTRLDTTTVGCSPTTPPQQSEAGAMTGAHWGAASDLSTFKQIGYGFDVATLDPNSPSSWPGILDAAQANGLKLIVGAYPEPYSYSNGQWTISNAGRNLLNYLASRSSLVLALYVFNEPYWISPVTGSSSSCGAMSAADLRGLRTTIQSVWPGAKIYHDLGQPSAWAPGGYLYNSNSCIGNKYADQSGVADYVGVWDYPFEASGYQETRALSTLNRETKYVIDSMHAVPVWLNQSHAASCCSLVFPTKAEILEWNCSVRAALPAGSLISWYVWRQGIYSDTLSAHPEDWASTTAAACP